MIIEVTLSRQFLNFDLWPEIFAKNCWKIVNKIFKIVFSFCSLLGRSFKTELFSYIQGKAIISTLCKLMEEVLRNSSIIQVSQPYLLVWINVIYHAYSIIPQIFNVGEQQVLDLDKMMHHLDLSESKRACKERANGPTWFHGKAAVDVDPRNEGQNSRHGRGRRGNFFNFVCECAGNVRTMCSYVVRWIIISSTNY